MQAIAPDALEDVDADLVAEPGEKCEPLDEPKMWKLTNHSCNKWTDLVHKIH